MCITMSDNYLKWTSIENVILDIFKPVFEVISLTRQCLPSDALHPLSIYNRRLRSLKNRLFNNYYEASIKIDGTNVGKDIQVKKYNIYIQNYNNQRNFF